MKYRFAKMHGLGNDFMVIDLVTQRAALRPERIRELADRHTGVGFDQLLALEPPHDADADFRFRIFNADGSEAAHCGNGARCVARFAQLERLSPKRTLRLELRHGSIETTLHDDATVSVRMGVPRLEPAAVPFRSECAQPVDALRYRLPTPHGDATLLPLSLGNPHAVLFVDDPPVGELPGGDLASAPVATLGAALESHAAFPERVNVGFCSVRDRGHLALRVFERGAGETRACGSGACAAVVAARLLGRIDEEADVALRGGDLRIAWPGPGHDIRMRGPAERVFEGMIRL
jgi:diaminopimelate epimerase